MGEIVMVIGKSGSGKSTSLRNIPDGECLVLNVAGKRLPFRGHQDSVKNPTYDVCKAALRQNDYNCYVIDDSTYLMQFENFDKAKIKGYDKFTEMAVAFRELLSCAIGDTDDDTLIYFMHHPQFGDDGSSKPQTIGKMLDNQLCVEGLFPIILEATVHEGEHKFKVKGDMNDIVKTPMSMFEGEYIDNDLKLVDDTIREYWGLSERKNGRNK